MTTSGGEQFAEGRYRSRELATDLSEQLELLSRSHRSFCARAAQELRRAERYRQFLSLVIVHGDQAGISDPTNPYEDLHGPLARLCAAVRSDSRVSDVVSGVEGGKFAVLLVETGVEGARRFCRRLAETSRSLGSAPSANGNGNPIPTEVFTFPEQDTDSRTLRESLDDLYRRSNIRPHTI